DEYSVFDEPGDDCWQQLDDYAGEYICYNYVAVDGAAVEFVHFMDGDISFKSVALNIISRDVSWQFVDICGMNPGRAQFGGRKGKNSGARADIRDHKFGFNIIFQNFQAQFGGRVAAGAEGHAGVQLHNEAGWVAFILFPTGLDYQLFAEFHGFPV